MAGQNKTDNEHNKRNEIVTQTVTNWTKQPNTTATTLATKEAKAKRNTENVRHSMYMCGCVCVCVSATLPAIQISAALKRAEKTRGNQKNWLS